MGDAILELPGRDSTERLRGRIENSFRAILRYLPKGEAEWADRGPQTESDMTNLFNAIIMHSIPLETRKVMPCRSLIEMFIQRMPQTPDPVYHITAAAACVVAMIDNQLTQSEAKVLLADIFPDERRDLKHAVIMTIRFLDMLAQHRVVGKRAYEVPSRCPSLPWLSRFNTFTPAHLELGHVILRDKEKLEVHVPENQIDSARLRVPNMLFYLFGARYSRTFIELAMMQTETNQQQSEELRPVRNQAPDPVPQPLHSRPIFKLVSLDEKCSKLQKTATVDVISLAATMRRRPHLKVSSAGYLWEELTSFVQDQEKTISDVTWETGVQVVDLNGREGLPPRIVRAKKSPGPVVPEGYMGFGILLQDRAPLVRFDQQTILWDPEQMLCFRGEPPTFEDTDEADILFMLALVQVEAF